jgi:hypothetical protein
MLLQRIGCLHHVCSDCTTSGGIDSCPIPNCGHAFGCAAAALPTDRMVLAGVVAAGGPAPTPKCDTCDDEANPADATHWCPKCEAHFCEECVKPHFTKRFFKQHPLLTVAEHEAAPGGAHGSTGSLTEGCQLHHKPREYYCRSCHAIGCAACIITGHNGDGHDTGLLEEMVGPLRIALQQCEGPLGTRCKVLRAGMDSMQAMRAALDDNEVAALADVDQATTAARQELNKAATGAKTEVGAGFRSRFATTLRRFMFQTNGTSCCPQQTPTEIPFCMCFAVCGAAHVCLWHTREPIPHGRCNQFLSLSRAAVATC